MDFTIIINRFKDILNCPLCSKSNQPLVRIRTCGHYMCENCSKKDKNRCLNCKETYAKNDIVPNLLAQKCRELLQDYLIEKPAIKNGPLKNDIKTFVYQNNTYTMVTYKKPVKLNSKGESPLHRACKKKQSNVVRQRLEEAYDLNLKDFAGWTVLHEAVEAGSMFIIEMLLKSGALVNVPGGNNITPLHDAVMQGKVDLIKLLLDYGADVNMIDSKGSKPINYTDKDDIKEMLSKPPIEQTHHYKLWFCETITVYCHSISPEYVAKLKQSKFAGC